MSMTTCRECNQPVSTEARACPHCGAKRPKRAGLLGIAFAGLFGYGIYSAVSGTGDRPPERPVSVESVAGGACMGFIKQRLHDPGSADFQGASVTPNGGDLYTVTQSVRARNAIGAMVMTSHTCELRRDSSSGDWHLLSLR